MILELAPQQTNFKHTIVTDVELKSGKKTQVITIFNNSEVNFEEMLIGIDIAFERQDKFYKNIKSTKHTFSTIKKEGLDPFIFMPTKEFN